MKIIIVDDEHGKADMTKVSCLKAGSKEEDIIEITRIPRSNEWDAEVPKIVKQIKDDNPNDSIVLLLDWKLTELNTEDVGRRLFANMIQDVLKEGDTVICNGSYTEIQYNEYKNILLGTNDDVYGKLVRKETTEKEGIKLVCIGHPYIQYEALGEVLVDSGKEKSLEGTNVETLNE